MRVTSIICVLVLGLSTMACGKKKKGTGSVSATIMKSSNVSAALVESKFNLTRGTGSTTQSFTPTSIKIPIFRVNLCSGTNSCMSIYQCAANTVEGCGVELAKIDDFVDALNAAPASLEEGHTYDHIGVQFCADGDSSGIQHITLNGTVKIAGVDYATDPTAGLVAGTSGKDTPIAISGGCASFYPMTPGVTVSKGSATTVKMFFDASYYAYGGIAGGNVDTSYSSSYCVGNENAHVCGQVITVVATVDSGTPTAEHYLLSNTDTAQGSTADSAPTAKVALYFLSDGTPIGGVQNSYRLSGSTVSWGHAVGGGLGLYPKTVDANTVSFGEPEGSVSLADWFKNFTRATHTGTYTYAGSGGTAVESTYKAVKL